MKVFREIYIYNQASPIYSSSSAKSYSCRNSKTNQTTLILIKHLKNIPIIDSHQNVLHPIQIPDNNQKISVYPLVTCISQIGKLQQSDAMYILKCLLQSPQKNPLYSIISPTGICTSNVEGLLLEPSPKIYQLMTRILDVPISLSSSSKTLISKECQAILKGLKDDQNILGSVNLYGWKQKKQNICDPKFVIFRGRRKQQGIIPQEYGLAWSNKSGVVRFKLYDRVGDIQNSKLVQYSSKIKYYMKNENKNLQIVKIHKYEEEAKSIKLFIMNPNQGYLNDYLNKRKQMNQPITQQQFFPILQKFVQTMSDIAERIRGHTCLHIKYLYLDNFNLYLGQPMLLTQKAQKKLRQLKNSMDYFSLQLKQNINLYENYDKLDHQKIDIWSFGFILHKIFSFQLPTFDVARKLILKKQKFSTGLTQLIFSCLNLNPAQRPKWKDIDFFSLKSDELIINEVSSVNSKNKEKSNKQQKVSNLNRTKSNLEEQIQRDNLISNLKKNQISVVYTNKQVNMEKTMHQETYLVDQTTIIKRKQNIQNIQIPQQKMAGRLKKIKLSFKIFIILILYLAVFFGPFLKNTINIIQKRGFLTSTTLYSIDNNRNTLSQTKILTTDPYYFMINDVIFTDIQNNFNCINDSFDPIYNPSFSLNTYIQSNAFIGYMISGWIYITLICIMKSMMIWKGGISNKKQKTSYKYWVAYVFSQLCMASLLFSHFYIYQFFYFAYIEPCLRVVPLNGVEPLFDSILYIFLEQQQGFMLHIFTTLGILSIILIASNLIYLYSPNSDSKNIFKFVSLILRITPYIFFILIARIGVFSLFSPTSLNDPLSMIPALINFSFNGFIGIIPQIFVVLCILTQILIEVGFYYCEKKAQKSDTLNKLFNIQKQKIINMHDTLDEKDHIQLKNDSGIDIKNQLDITQVQELQ